MIPFDLESLRQDSFVRRIEYFDQTPSTNTIAVTLAEHDDGPFPLLVLAARQTAGRGRGANRWWSSEGALTFSLALDADRARLPPARRPLVSLAAGLAACETIATLAAELRVGVKWPNDVYLEGKKICGVLVESARRGERLVIGVGMNVNNTLAEAPPEVVERAIALIDASGRMFSLTEVLRCFLQRFADHWESLAAGDLGLIERLRNRCILTGRFVAVDAGGEPIAGLCRGIADDGALMLENEAGLRRVYAGVVAAID